MVEEVNDPLLGQKRDAFPGEVVPPEQQKTLQRLMREDEKRFLNLYEDVKDGLTPEEQNAVLKAGKIKAERERIRYLEGIRQNPANILRDVLQQLNPKENARVNNALIKLNENITKLQSEVEREKNADQLKGTKRETIGYVADLLSRNIRNTESILTTLSASSAQKQLDEKIIFNLLKISGLLPVESLRSLKELRDAVVSSNNQPSSGKPFFGGSRSRFVDSIEGLSSNRPGLEGITARIEFIDYYNINVPRVSIIANSGALAGIIDRGKYVPYNPNA